MSKTVKNAHAFDLEGEQRDRLERNMAAIRRIDAGDSELIGHCDECDLPYDVFSTSDHCPEHGTCLEHCPSGCIA
jgi:hypothetical protein